MEASRLQSQYQEVLHRRSLDGQRQIHDLDRVALPRRAVDALATIQQPQSASVLDEIGDLRDIVHSKSSHMDEALDKFYKKWKHETLVMQKWLTVQATAPFDDTYERVVKLQNDPAITTLLNY